ncbi:MAG: peptidoglycan DD-metalloendopeptidase family protein [Peptoniphilus sp.]|uniref:murein hydrolase activator EnvC family protein n=1 Tax=Peptoniphilus sp. TaxID=1971214 RepID=UPI002A755592|nr:peptidoglycan DD-metalloendopeptidase family protein [Peptoniphilus sp.]MDY2986849.1 peptidoglycan DD-metalloendopeptidase family protein [Peptoniphilus sp.]
MKNMRTSVAIISATVLLSSSVYASSSSLEKQKTNIQKQKQQISEQLKKSKNSINEVQKNVNTVQGEIIEIDKKISGLSNGIYALETEITALKEDIDRKSKELVTAQEDLEKSKRLFTERVRAMYMNGKVEYIEVILNSRDIEELLLNYEIISSIADSDKKLLDEISEKINVITNTKKILEDNKVKIEASKSKLESEKNQYVAANQKKQEYMNKLQLDVQAYTKEYEIAENEWTNLDKEILKLQDEIKIAKQREALAAQQAKAGINRTANLRNLNLGPRSGANLSWPVPGCYSISSPFGYRIHPILGTSRFHSGVDIPASSGTPVIAVRKGTVIMAKFMNGYGNVVMVDHGDIVTVYAHNSALKVVPGQTVSTGDVIALVGSTGLSTGPHLHFEVRVEGQPVNPLNYI